LLLAVIECPIAYRTLGFDPELVVIGADPSLPIPAELGVAAVPAALELIEDGVGENGLVHYRLHRAWFDAKARLAIGGGTLGGRWCGQGDENHDNGDDASAHATCTSRNIPVSMW
jgi:hypothetical protein